MTTVRVGEGPDLAAVAELLAHSTQDPWTTPMLQETLSSQSCFLFVAERSCPEPGLVGVLFGVHLDDEAQVLQVAVAPDCRRCGLAHRLLSAGHGALATLGVRRLSLEVRAGNEAAIGLYEGMGYVLAGRRRAFYRDGEDALAMVMDLSLELPASR